MQISLKCLTFPFPNPWRHSPRVTGWRRMTFKTNAKSKESLVFFNSTLKTGHILESAHLNSTASLNTQLAVVVLIRKKISLKLLPTCLDHKIYIFFSLIYLDTITYGHILNSFPYKNTVDLVELKGKDLLKVFEQVTSMYSKRKPSVSFLQVSGILLFIHHPDRNRVCLKEALKATTQQ